VAAAVDGVVAVAANDLANRSDLTRWGADWLIELKGTEVEEDVSAALATWSKEVNLWAILVPSTLWGREVASRLAARLGAGLTGDAVRLGVTDGRLVGWKPAFGGRLVAAITTKSEVSLATVRPGVLNLRAPRPARRAPTTVVSGHRIGRVTVTAQTHDDDVASLMAARAIVCVGQGVGPDEYDELRPLLGALGAELGATRRVTDREWLPRSRQIGITGHSVAPVLYIGIAVSGKFNHMVGVSGAGTIFVVNSDPEAPAFSWCDIGIVADWRAVVPLLTEALTNDSTWVGAPPPAAQPVR
jgi:electron transfer flavoprotein alpha subunit